MKRSFVNSTEDSTEDSTENSAITIDETNKKQKKNTIKMDSNIKFSVKYHDFKTMLTLFFEFHKFVKIVCANNEIKFIIEKCDFKNKKNELNTFNKLFMFAYFEKDKMINYSTNLSDDEIYESLIPIKHILDSLNTLKFQLNSVVDIELSYSEKHLPVVKIIKTTSETQYHSTMFEYDINQQLNRQSNRLLNKPSNKQIAKSFGKSFGKPSSKSFVSTQKNTKKPFQMITSNAESNDLDKSDQTNQIDQINQTNQTDQLNDFINQLVFSTTMSTINFFEAIATIENVVNEATICYSNDIVKLFWNSIICNQMRENEYSLTTKNNTLTTNTTDVVNLVDSINKKCDVNTMYCISAYSFLLSTDMSLHFFSNSKFIINFLIGESGNLVVDFD